VIDEPSATLDSIEDALFTALQSTGPLGSKDFTLIARFDGEPTQQALAEATLGNTPAALLSQESDDPVPELTVETLVGEIEEVFRATFCVYVVVEDPRGDAEAEKGSTNAPGYLALTDCVRKALTGLAIPGLAGTGIVRCRGARRARTEHGVVYARVLRFSADYAGEQVEQDAEGVPLTRIDTNFDLDGNELDNPVSKSRNNF
jgi:hypothetical protein